MNVFSLSSAPSVVALRNAAAALMDAAYDKYMMVVERTEDGKIETKDDMIQMGTVLVRAGQLFSAAHAAYVALRDKDGELKAYTKIVECVGAGNALTVDSMPRFPDDDVCVALYRAWDKRTDPGDVGTL